MSKAYDRVEWNFLEKLLLKLRFVGRWVDTEMDCVTTVSYSFIANGGVCGSVTPSRGLRQGDPLSPYIYILVANAFSGLLRKAMVDDSLHGARASRKVPEISHLLFANDNLLFARANRRECSKIVETLNIYEAASGQKINYDKSEVSFRKGVCTSLQEELLEILAMRRVDSYEKYLVIPTIVRRSKRMVFMALKDRIWKKLNGWKEKLLFRAGKEILLKAMIQAIPNYLESRLGFASSYSWQSIWSSKTLLKEGILWRIGDGATVNILCDPWIGSGTSRFISTPKIDAFEIVGKLIDQEIREWNVALISSIFNDQDTCCILPIPLSSRSLSDTVTWAFSMDGFYSVKTAYMLGKSCN
ncbi:uncharacterized protein LOC110717051 [Chenopodium quinoa]|uniref:uncharacterized protein LOC110717051 n=1 Tax=Chenopodium quinoa TaxID=63459 RepID=UPI000B773E95|nr:uncharacterized protein LOC110717051 [Chenopodium quinoa]